VATGVSSTTVCRRPISQTTSCPSSSGCPRTARASIPCGGRDSACQRVGTEAVDPARAQAGVPSCCGGSSGQRPWCHYMSSCLASHVAAHPLRRTDMSAPVGTGHDMSAPSAGVGSWSALPGERVAGRPGREATPHGGQAPGWGERWHRICTRAVQKSMEILGIIGKLRENGLRHVRTAHTRRSLAMRVQPAEVRDASLPQAKERKR
jgi:hypothetical protein